MKITSVKTNPSTYTIKLSDEIIIMYESIEKVEHQIISELTHKIFELLSNSKK